MFQVSHNFFNSDPIAAVPSAVTNSDHHLNRPDTVLETCIYHRCSVENRICQRFQLHAESISILAVWTRDRLCRGVTDLHSFLPLKPNIGILDLGPSQICFQLEAFGELAVPGQDQLEVVGCAFVFTRFRNEANLNMPDV